MDKARPFVSKLKPPTITPQSVIQGRVPNKEEPLSKFHTRRLLLSRRSKSAVDLRAPLATANLNPAAKGQPFVKSTSRLANLPTNKPNLTNRLHTQTKPSAATVSKGAVKRPAPTPATAVQAKVLKPSKPAPYDYKARYNLLNDKHTTLVNQYKEQKCKIDEYETLLQSYSTLRSDYNVILSLKNEYEIENQDLKEKVVALTEKSEKLAKLEVEHSELTANYIKVSKRCDQLESSSKILKTQVCELELMVSDFKECIQNNETNRRIMHNQIQDLKGNIRVFCRVRPSLQHEEYRLLCNINYIDEQTFDITKSTEGSSLTSGKQLDSKLEFNFDKVFSPHASQTEVFEELSYLVQSALDGYHVCVFAYGQTGSGKTYTMQGGGDSNSNGMIPRTVDLIFDLKHKLETIGWVYTIEVSFLEIYNETIRDLIDPKNNNPHEIRFNMGQGTTVTNLTVKEANSAEELRYYMSLSNKNRATASTNFNEHSSRSHSVTKICLKGTNKEMNVSYIGSLNLVDLAGSENAKNSDRMVETKNINKSLSTLGTVMSALHKKESHIPYRNSKLTFLLQSCLGGNSKTLMFVNVAPLEECYSESVNSLRFASKVKEVKLGSRKNFNKPNVLRT